VNVYLDASVLVALFTRDAFTERASAYLDAELPILVVSDFAATEFASAVARLMRINQITAPETRAILGDFDSWRLRVADTTGILSADVTTAASFIRRLDLTLRTADAINIAIAQRIGATLATFDVKMADSARAIGVPVAAA
jgi:predicted nucleic acid-binding protein